MVGLDGGSFGNSSKEQGFDESLSSLQDNDDTSAAECLESDLDLNSNPSVEKPEELLLDTIKSSKKYVIKKLAK